MTPIAGNTYPVKDQLKALGGRWNPDEKVWMVPDDRAQEAGILVASAPKAQSSRRRPSKCVACGVLESRDARGYPLVKIYRSGECQDCFEERKMGY